MEAHFGGSCPIDTIRRRDARAFYTALLAGELQHVSKSTRPGRPNPTTVGKHLRHIIAMFNQAVDDEVIEANPFMRIASTQTPPKAWRYVSIDDFWKLYDAASDQWPVLFSLCRLSSMRRSDAMNLGWPNIDLRSNEITYTSVKTGTKVEVPVCPELREVLELALRLRPSLKIEGDRVIDRSIYLGNIGRDVAVMCRNAGIDVYADPLHTLRKSCITDWTHHHPPHVVKQWAGHRSIKTTLNYYTQIRDLDMQAGKTQRIFSRQLDANLVTKAPLRHPRNKVKLLSG